MGWDLGLSQTRSNSYADQSSFSSSFGLNASVSLFNGLSNYHTINQRLAEMMASEQELKYQKEMLALDISSAYLTVLLDAELINAQQVQVNLTEENHRKLDLKYNNGALPQSQLVESKAQLAQERAKLIELENNKHYDLLVLAQKLELPSADSFGIVIPDAPLENAEISLLSANDLFAASVNARPEIESARLTMESKRFALKTVKSYYYPSLSFQAAYNNGYFSNDPMTFGTQISNNDRKYLGFSVQIPIFNKMQVNSQVSTSELSFQKSQNDYEIQKTVPRNHTKGLL
ncbi:MAG: TolC family protein [Bacteroidales bacterium]|nr:TolC family protein [Bacteroidales bacterium]